MPKRFRPSRRPPIAMTADGGRRQKRLTANAGLDAGQALVPPGSGGAQGMGTAQALRWDLGICAEKKPWVRPDPTSRTRCEMGRRWAGAASPRTVIGSPACTALTRVPLYG